ncbi:uncharacterized protein [Littorina saxatilis]|uniref:uncharacterized protein n=1 Tax=Littorina saxatilis TaxID=31220 RepID=UPI0038B5775D
MFPLIINVLIFLSCYFLCDILGDKPQSSHTARKEKAETAWDKLRKKLLESRLEMLAPFAVVCSFCQADLQEGSFVRCSDCGPCVFYCLTCDSKIHSVLQFHKQYVWTEGKTYLPVKRVPRLCQQSLHQCECDAVQTSNIVLFDCEGMSSDAVIEHCLCHREQLAVTLLRHGFWPASPASPKVAFSLQLMELCACLQLHGSISVQAIAMSLKEMDPLLGLRPQASSVPDLYRNLLGAINEYRFHRSQISRTGALSKASIHSCPVCSMNPSGAVTSLDGNFGLVHKRRTGGLEKARHQNVFFFKDENVQQFVQDWAADRRNIATNCSQFQAGDTLRSKNKTAGLDVTGVFGSVCQHEFPGVMVNLKHGERLSYPVFILQDLLSRTKNISAPQKQLVMYDVACMLRKHLEVRKSQLLQHFTFSVPAFHRFAHNMACQLSFGQRCTVGAGLHDGEGMERVWAYLRGFASVSKQMTLANREDLLTDALLAYSRRSFGQLRKKLVGQMETADRIQREAQTDLEPLERQLVREAGGDSQNWLDSWKAEVATQTNHKVSGSPKL